MLRARVSAIAIALVIAVTIVMTGCAATPAHGEWFLEQTRSQGMHDTMRGTLTVKEMSAKETVNEAKAQTPGSGREMPNLDSNCSFVCGFKTLPGTEDWPFYLERGETQ